MSLAAVAISPAPAPVNSASSRSGAFFELENVTHTYGQGERKVHALTETTLRIEKGDVGQRQAQRLRFLGGACGKRQSSRQQEAQGTHEAHRHDRRRRPRR